MEGKAYRIKVYTDSLAYVHGFSCEIWEIYIPVMGVIVNEEKGAFKATAPREHEGDLIDVDVPYETMTTIQAYINAKEKFERLNDELFKKLG